MGSLLLQGEYMWECFQSQEALKAALCAPGSLQLSRSEEGPERVRK